MVQQKVVWPKQPYNSTGVQSGVNLTGMAVSSQSRELKTSSVADHDAMTTPPTGGGSEAGAQESPSISDVKWEYDTVLPDKGKGKAVPDDTAKGGSGHDSVKAYAYMHKVNPNIFPHFLSFYMCITILSLFAHHSNFFWIFPYFSSHSIHFKTLSLWHGTLDFASV